MEGFSPFVFFFSILVLYLYSVSSYFKILGLFGFVRQSFAFRYFSEHHSFCLKDRSFYGARTGNLRPRVVPSQIDPQIIPQSGA